MKSTGVNVGSVKLRGKVTKLLRCGCCEAKNLKWRYAMKLALKQIDYEKSGTAETN